MLKICVPCIGKNAKIIHFIGASKPWKAYFNQQGDLVPNRQEDSHSIEHLRDWWNIYRNEVKPREVQVSSKTNSYVTFIQLTFLYFFTCAQII